MKMSKRVSYGILAAIDLAIHAKDAPIQAKAVSRRQHGFLLTQITRITRINDIHRNPSGISVRKFRLERVDTLE